MPTVINPISDEILDLLENLDKDICHISSYPKVNKTTSHGDIYKIDNYCLKVFSPLKIGNGQVEIKALLRLQGKDYVPKLYAYNKYKYILIEWIEGYNLPQYIENYKKIPDNLFDEYYTIMIDMIESKVSYIDTKYNEHLIWLPNSKDKFKIIDYGVCDLLDNQNAYTYMLKSKKNEYNDLKNHKQSSLEEIEKALFTSGIDSNIIENFMSKLIDSKREF